MKSPALSELASKQNMGSISDHTASILTLEAMSVLSENSSGWEIMKK